MGSKHFKSRETACKHCGDNNIDHRMYILLELVRERFKQPVVVTSGYRCQEHNTNIGGVKNSSHVKGIACDVVVKGVESKDVYDYLDSVFPNMLGLGLYETFTHIDLRHDKAYRW